ncbi:helix-turn-helix domain-containing protein [Pediococcus pentosaceus]|uniref:helix-turn-helix domain-containing protein n=1 Tax=Pediococcus pentosaceus TaxID=1255 RepID=UPI002FBF18A7
MTTFERINELAKKRGIGLRVLASKAGLGETTIYGWKKRTPDSSKLEAVAKVLGVSVDYLLGKNETPEWANEKDTKDLETFLERNLEGGMTYGGEDLTEEEKQQVKLAMTTIFWKRHKRD